MEKRAFGGRQNRRAENEKRGRGGNEEGTVKVNAGGKDCITGTITALMRTPARNWPV